MDAGLPVINKKYLQWLAIVVAIILVTAIRSFTESDADKKAHQDAIASKMNDLIARHDKTGQIAEFSAFTSLLESFFNGCKATVSPVKAGAAVSDEDKKNYCTCATLGMNKLYFSKLSDSETIERSKLPATKDQSPANVRKEVFSACSASLDAYR